MGGFLARIGRGTYRHRWLTLIVWLLILVAVTSLSVAFSKPESTQFTVPGTQSQQAMDLLEQRFPAASGATAQIVFAAPEATTLNDATLKAGVEATLAKARQGAQVLLVTDPYSGKTISKNGRIGYATVAFKVPASAITDAAKVDLGASAGPARAAGATVAYGGGIVNQPTTKSSDVLGLLIAYLVLTITFGSMIAAGLPLINALDRRRHRPHRHQPLSGLVSLSATAPILATMLGLAVAIDYALFIVYRFRDEIGKGVSHEEAATTAAGTAGVSVVFAGTTVIVALVGLSVTGIPFLTIMGLCAAADVIVAVLIAVTLIPALLGFGGVQGEAAPGQGRGPGILRRVGRLHDEARRVRGGRRGDRPPGHRLAAPHHGSRSAERGDTAEVRHGAHGLRPDGTRLRARDQRAAARGRRRSGEAGPRGGRRDGDQGPGGGTRASPRSRPDPEHRQGRDRGRRHPHPGPDSVATK